MKKFVSLALIFLTVGVFIAAGTTAYADFAQSPPLEKFIQPLRGLGGTTGIPLAASDGTRKWPGVTATHYTIDIGQFTDKLHPALPETTLWGFGQYFDINNPHWTRHLGGIIVAERDKPIQITFRNRLTTTGNPDGAPLPNIIPVDTSLVGGNVATNRTAVHAHGGFVPWISDGGPFDWWTPGDNNGALTGTSFLNNQVLRPGQNVPSNEAEYYYPNSQSARFVWYHDHAYGITRINAYAGIASAYVITDWYEKLLTYWPVNLPGPTDPRTIYLVFQDKIFVSESTSTNAMDPTWNSVAPTVSQQPGSLWYAHVYDLNRWGPLGPNPAGDLPNPSVIPEFFGDTILVNGTVFPTVTLEQREYRFRMLNACNARFLNFRLVNTDSTGLEPDSYDYINYIPNPDPNLPPIPVSTNPPPTSAPGFAQVQIGSEGGFLPYPAHLNTVGQDKLLLAPAERSDMIFDFRNVPPGKYILYNNAPGPYPAGDDINDYFPGNPNNPTVSQPGSGPNTRTLLQIIVKPIKPGTANKKINLPPFFTPTDPFLIFQKPSVPSPLPASGADSMYVTVFPFFKVKANVRHLTLNEDTDQFGRLIQKLGTNVATGSTPPPPPIFPTFGRDLTATPTELTKVGNYEVWEIANLTGDTHPIHFHLVNVQVLARRAFDVTNYNGTPNFIDANNNATPVLPPDFNELGWKETVRMNPGQVTWVLMKFELPRVPFKVPSSPRIDAYGMTPTGWIANEYVWHCHILEHEEHDMMRPVVVFSPEQKW
jgi:spore coat protein A, manganese oxidase